MEHPKSQVQQTIRYHRRFFGLAGALAITTGVFLMLSRAGWMNVGTVQTERQLVLIAIVDAQPMSRAVPEPTFVRPQWLGLSAPNIEIAADEPSEVSHSDAIPLIPPTLPARTNPAAPNDDPEYPKDFKADGQTGRQIVIATVLVLEDGSIGDAQLAGTCGFPELDDAALAYIKRHWRFLPALRDGKPVKDRLTLEVLFKRN
jgi:TonB family protein